MHSLPNSVPEVLYRLARLLNTDVKSGRLEIPSEFGTGYCAGYIFNEHLRMLIANYSLNEAFSVENPDIHAREQMILMKFQHIFPPGAQSPDKTVPSVLIATSRIHTDEVIPIDTINATLNIEVSASYLRDLEGLSGKSLVNQSLLQNNQPLLFEQMLPATLQKTLHEILSESVNPAFQLFFLRIKAEELVCRLLMELENRDDQQLYALNSRDIRTVYEVKELILQQLGTPPVIRELAATAHMSPTKLKRLFRQIFGNSIFSYYQELRMKEAARLLRAEKVSVSEAGYQMGFTNLSHFSRVFQQHIGMKPKQYSRDSGR